MRLTTKGRFAVTAMIDVAMQSTKGPATLAGVSDRQKISLSYLEQLFGKLRRCGLVESVRGPGGGYRLSRRPQDISVAEVITAIGEGIDTTQCQGNRDCQDGDECLTHQLWTKLGREIFDFLNGITLASFIERDDVNKVIQRQQGRVTLTAPRLSKTLV